MQLLCIAALLLSAVAARPKQDETFAPAGGPKRDGDFKAQGMPQLPGNHNKTRPHRPVAVHPSGAPNRNTRQAPGSGPSGQPGKPQGPPNGEGPLMKTPGHPGPAVQPGKPQGPPKGEDPHMNKPGPLGSGGHSGKPEGHQKGEKPHMKKPGPPVNIEFFPRFKVDNVTFQNATNVTLSEGESIFLRPELGERGPPPPRRGHRGPPLNGQYVKLIYNSTMPNKVSMEFGAFKPMNIGALVREEDNDEDADW